MRTWICASCSRRSTSRFPGAWPQEPSEGLTAPILGAFMLNPESVPQHYLSGVFRSILEQSMQTFSAFPGALLREVLAGVGDSGILQSRWDIPRAIPALALHEWQ